MIGEGNRGEEGIVKMEEDVKENKIVFMWGYLPGALPQRTPLLCPMVVRLPGKDGTDGQVWRDVCGGGCGFAMAISGDFSLNHLFFSFLLFLYGIVCICVCVRVLFWFVLGFCEFLHCWILLIW